MVEHELGPDFWAEYLLLYETVKRFRAYRELVGQMAREVCKYAPIVDLPVLDAGCGTGDLTFALRGAGVCDVMGIDSCPQAIEMAREKMKTRGNSPEVFQVAGLNMEPGSIFDDAVFKQGSFRAISCCNALYAVRDPRLTMARLMELLAPGGVLVVATPKKGASKAAIAWHHVRTGGLPAVQEMFQMMPDLRKITPMTKKIELECTQYFFTEAEIQGLVGGKYSLGLAYANQDWLLTCRK